MQFSGTARTLGSRLLLVGLAALTLLIVVPDYLSGSEISFSIFYVVPVSLAAWRIGWRAGVLISVLSTALWFTADRLTHEAYSHTLVPYWNALVRLGFFLTITYVLAALRAARAMQEELSQFVVHDLRSPAAAIGAAVAALSRDADGLGERPRSLLGVVGASAKRINTLIGALLDLSRLESGKMPVRMAEISIPELLAPAREHVELWQGLHPITFNAEVSEGVSTVYADPDLTQRVLINLVSNALQHAPTHTAVTVSVARDDAGDVVFGVTDHGPGIPTRWLSRVFNKFEQVEARRDGAAVGTGVGLAFCKMAVQAQGGRIWVESQPEQSTTFSFSLPAGPPAA